MIRFDREPPTTHAYEVTRALDDAYASSRAFVTNPDLFEDIDPFGVDTHTVRIAHDAALLGYIMGGPVFRVEPGQYVAYASHLYSRTKPLGLGAHVPVTLFLVSRVIDNVSVTFSGTLGRPNKHTVSLTLDCLVPMEVLLS